MALKIVLLNKRFILTLAVFGYLLKLNRGLGRAFKYTIFCNFLIKSPLNIS